VTNNAPSPTVSGIAIDPGLLAALRPGAKLRRTIGDKTPAPWTELWHVRAIVDGEYVVYRYWSRRGRHWVYQLDNLHFLHLCWKSGTLEEA
jgi:hypothetical protein